MDYIEITPNLSGRSVVFVDHITSIFEDTNGSGRTHIFFAGESDNCVITYDSLDEILAKIASVKGDDDE